MIWFLNQRASRKKNAKNLDRTDLFYSSLPTVFPRSLPKFTQTLVKIPIFRMDGSKIIVGPKRTDTIPHILSPCTLNSCIFKSSSSMLNTCRSLRQLYFQPNNNCNHNYSTNNNQPRYLLLLLLYLLSLCASTTHQSVLRSTVFFDDFESGRLDYEKWKIGKTQWGGCIDPLEICEIPANGGVVPENVQLKRGPSGQVYARFEVHGNNYTGR